jgi:WD40 repeat protein
MNNTNKYPIIIKLNAFNSYYKAGKLIGVCHYCSLNCHKKHNLGLKEYVQDFSCRCYPKTCGITQQILNQSELKGHTGSVETVAVTSDNKYIVSSGFDKTIILWDLTNNGQATVLGAHNDCVFPVVITSDNRYVVSSSKDETIIVWDLQNGTQKVL